MPAASRNDDPKVGHKDSQVIIICKLVTVSICSIVNVKILIKEVLKEMFYSILACIPSRGGP